jgi:uncharacterized protein YbaR (Trm112 family)
MGTSEIATVSCPCGTPIEVDLRTSKPVRVCPECKESLTIVATVDAQTGNRRIGILVAPAAVGSGKPRKKPSAPAPAPAPASPLCGCGAGVVVDLRSVDAVYTCAWCGACYTAMSKLDPATGLESPVLLAVKVVPLRKEKKTTVRRVKPKAESAPSVTLKESLLLIAGGTLGAQPLVESDSGSLITCFCKHEIAVSGDASKRILTCPDCGAVFRLFLAIDPRTDKPMAITVPQPGR